MGRDWEASFECLPHKLDYLSTTPISCKNQVGWDVLVIPALGRADRSAGFRSQPASLISKLARDPVSEKTVESQQDGSAGIGSCHKV